MSVKLENIPSVLKDRISEMVVAKLQQAQSEIVANIENKGIRASGRTQSSLQVVRDGDSRILLISRAGEHAPFPTLERGRKGGKVPFNLEDILQQWARDKGISFASEKDERRFAVALKWKIAKSGTRRHYNNEDVYSSVAERTKEEIINAANEIVAGIVNNI